MCPAERITRGCHDGKSCQVQALVVCLTTPPPPPGVSAAFRGSSLTATPAFMGVLECVLQSIISFIRNKLHFVFANAPITMNIL